MRARGCPAVAALLLVAGGPVPCWAIQAPKDLPGVLPRVDAAVEGDPGCVVPYFASFPLDIDKYTYVASTHVNVEIGFTSIQLYDEAFYLERNNVLWRTRNITEDMFLHHATGHGLIVQKVTGANTLVGRGTFLYRMYSQAFVLIMGSPAVASEEDNRAVARQLEERLRSGPALHTGSIMSARLLSSGVKLCIDGHDLGEIPSPALSKAHLAGFATYPEFRDLVYSSLGQGLPRGVSPPMDVTSLRIPRYLFVLIALSHLACCCFCCAMCAGAWMRAARGTPPPP